MSQPNRNEKTSPETEGKKPFPIRWVFYVVFGYAVLHTLYFIAFGANPGG